MRPSDPPTRFNGEEFALLVAPDLGIDLSEMARRIIDKLSVNYLVDKHRLDVGANIGTVTTPDADGALRKANPLELVDQMMRHANSAMYEAKQSGWVIMVTYTEEVDRRERKK